MFVRKRTYEELHRKYELLDQECTELLEKNVEANEKIEELMTAVESIRSDMLAAIKKSEELESNLLKDQESTSITLRISDDLSSITPVTKVKSSTVNKLVEHGYLPFNKRDNEFAINLAALLVANEGMEQLVFTFEEALRDGVAMEGSGDDDEA